MWGFDNLKDILDVLIIPTAIFGLSFLLPYLFERNKRVNFINLIKREFHEIEPEPKHRDASKQWTQHLKKRFIHAEIFKNPSENRDFILSLNPDFAYDMSQLWTTYEKAHKITLNHGENETIQTQIEYGKKWCHYLQRVCYFLDHKVAGQSTKKSKLAASKDFYKIYYNQWKDLIDEYENNGI